MANFKDVGRLTNVPEMKIVGGGKCVVNFILAVDRNYVGKESEKKADFHSVEVWGKQAEACANYLDKGRLVLVEGNLQNNTYEDKETGKKIYGYKIVADIVKFLDFGKKEG